MFIGSTSQSLIHRLILVLFIGISACQQANAGISLPFPSFSPINFCKTMLDYSKNNPITALCVTAAPIAAYYYHTMAQSYKPLKWNWQTRNYTTPQKFPQGFLWGTGTSAYQVEGGCDNNNWAIWEKSCDKDGKPRVQAPCGRACDHWNRYKEDTQLMKQLGTNAYRFSVEWSKIEPQEGKFNQEALEHYRDVCRELRNNGIQPCITIHHYTDPLWFVAKGGFEKDENVQCYVRFATTLIKALHEFDPLWFTFNSPDGYAAQGYLTCTKPAGRLEPIKDMGLFAQVYKNLLEAHVQTYRAIKQDKEYSHARIGILKNMFQLEPYRIHNPLDMLACTMGKKMVDTPFFSFFTKGTFDIYIPFKVSLHHTNQQAKGALDFIGINYYSHGYMSFFKPIAHPDEEQTNNERYSIYAEGLYRAVKEIAQTVAKPLSIPMYITENGIACDNDDAKRTTFLQKYLYALSQAIAEGCDVRGYFYWSLMDNYEWGRVDKCYGLYAVDLRNDPELKRTLRPGSQFYIDTIAANAKR